ncbi:hypothetical protein A5892_03425 [Halotalea alkalilenta]|uniref:M23ase beta-sheet core domain-containing protein n=1 Tax=Halotalea alkalilenta TaxID=376489 RepID=A0A172YBK6_9GAMM|nr:hypothetical protein A5892_03425 [Halotalea alkalilenta]
MKLASLATLSLLATLATPLQAADVDVSPQRLREINADIASMQARLRSTESQRDEARSALRQAEQALAQTHAQLATLGEQRQSASDTLAQLDQRLGELREESAAQKAALAAQLNALYRLGAQPELKLLLEQRDPTQLERYQRYLNAIEGARRERLETLARLDREINANRAEASRQHQTLERLIEEQRSREQRLAGQQSERESALARLDASYANDQARLTDLGEQRRDAEETLARIEREVAAARAAAERAAAERARQAEQARQAELARQAAERERQAEQARIAQQRDERARATEELARRTQQQSQPQPQPQPQPQQPQDRPAPRYQQPASPPSGSQLTEEEMNAEAPGTLASREPAQSAPPPPPPAPSAQSEPRQRAGSAWSGRWPIEGRLVSNYGEGEGLSRNGVVIQAAEGTPIHAIRAGQVVFADWLNGFGYLVIVDHGGTLTVYAHNQRNSVEVGDRVERGTVLGTVGDTGGRSSPALYFEVRRGGKPVNPTGWLSASR